jgi:perosamine synthetase
MITSYTPADLDGLMAFRDRLSPLDRRRFAALDGLPDLAPDRYWTMLVKHDPHDGIVGYGHLERFPQPQKRHVARLGIAVDRRYRGTGLSGHLMEALLAHAEAAELSKVWLSVHADNEAAIHLYERFGFTLEGCFRDEERWPEPVSVVAMALTLPRPRVHCVSWSRPDVRTAEGTAVLDVLHSGWLSQGPRTKALEDAFARFVGVEHAVALSNGTAGLYALYASLFRPGDKVIVPTLTFVSTVNAALVAGLEPVLADVDPGTGNIDLDHVEALCRNDPSIRGLMVVDLAGQPVNLPSCEVLCAAHSLILVEDAAEAVGAACCGGMVGGFGHPALFSLHTAKLVTAIEGGIVTTQSAELAASLRAQRAHGELPSAKWVHASLGLNFRLTDLQAAVGLVQLGRIDEFLHRRLHIVDLYRAELGEHLTFQEVAGSTTTHSYMMCLVQAPQRDALAAHLHSRGIETRSVLPVHRQPCHRHRYSALQLPRADAWAERGLCLPLYNGMTDSEAGRVIDAVIGFYRG